MKTTLLTLSCLFLAVAVHAQTYNARGDFNGWGETPLVANGNGTYSLSISGGTVGATFEWKIAQNDWENNWPGSNVKSVYDASGNFTFHFIPGTVTDGWNPGANRVGYDDPGLFGWEIMGSFNDWGPPFLTLNPAGNGVYSGTAEVIAPGSYEFKFRKAGDWDISIGGDFGNSAGNAVLVTTLPNELIEFQLDLPNGRWQAAVVPEPGLLSMFALGTMLLLGLRRQKRN
jgi:hypothetical protein